jgi:thiol-disulfide isomerase/thioredoxin
MQKFLALAPVLFFSCFALAQAGLPPTDLACRWSAQLIAARPGVDDSYLVPFELRIEHAPKGLRAAILNGADHMEFSSAVQQGREVTLRLDQYDATLSAHCLSGSAPCSAMEGEYVRQKGSSLSRYRFRARCGGASPDLDQASDSLPQLSMASDWQFTFTDPSGKPDSEPNAPARFAQDARHVEGTIAPISGDYGMLSGELSGGSNAVLHLSRFDGVHALRLDGHFVSPNRIEGVFHVAPGTPLNFVATRSDSGSAGFREAEQLTRVENPAVPFSFRAVDALGATITENDPSFRGKVVLLDVFGTWCPNCHDEAPVLQSLYTEFQARGLVVVGLSYEYVEDRAHNKRLLDIYRRKYSITFPLLLAGTTDSGQIARTLPQLRGFGAYPTTIFLDRHGRVRLIHAGFSGPATGRLEEVKQSFERTIVQLLDEQ